MYGKINDMNELLLLIYTLLTFTSVSPAGVVYYAHNTRTKRASRQYIVVIIHVVARQ